MFGRRNKVDLLQLLNAIECYPLGSWGAGDNSSMAKLVVCAHLMGRDYGMDVPSERT